MNSIVPKVAVTGCWPKLPRTFPVDHPENAGNMIHGRAPLEMFPKTIFAGDPHKPWGPGSSFRHWVNNEATHIVVTLANIFRLDKEDGSSLARFQKSLESYDAELVVFGMGVQAPTTSLQDATLSQEAVNLMKYLGERCRVVGVRGEFTKKVFSHFAGVENTYITGCPSLFSRPEAIRTLYDNWNSKKIGLRAYSGTNFHTEVERNMLADCTKRKQFLVEPVSKANHQFYLDSLSDLPENELRVPYYLKRKVASGELRVSELKDYFSRYYRLFRNPDAWLEFYEEQVSFSYGTRFHVNMASMLAGVPSLWLTHDARTAELVDFFHLPSMPLEQAAEMTPEEIEEFYDPTAFFDNVGSLFDNFNGYLDIFDLPPQKLDF